MKTLRRYFLVLFGALTVLGLILTAAACGEKKVRLSFDVGGGTAVEAVEVAPGEEFDLPAIEREGYEFQGWYSDPGFSDAVQSPVTVPETDTQYYAKWEALPAIALELDGGTLEKTTLYLKAGEDLYSFMQSVIPAKTNREFGEWLLGGERLALNTRMPAAGVTLTAHWKVPYTLEFYKQDTGLEQYVKDEALTRTGFGYVGETVGEDEGLEHFTYVPERSHPVTLEDKDDNTATAYFDRDVYFVVYEANAPAGAEMEGEMPGSLSYAYEEEAAILPSGFSAEGYRFLGWATSADGEVEFVPEETVPMESNLRLYCVWDDAPYRDALGGNDYLFLDPDDATKVYLQRRGLPEIAGTLGVPQEGYFTFEADRIRLTGRLSEAKRSFFYLMEDVENTYIVYDGYLGTVSYLTTLSIKGYGYASVSVYARDEEKEAEHYVGELLATIDGTYDRISDPDWGAIGIYTFTADETPDEEYAAYEQFNFELGYAVNSVTQERINFFAVQGEEAINGSLGLYTTIVENRFTYPYLVVNGFGDLQLVAGPDDVATGNYMPANYLASHATAGKDEFAVWGYDGSGMMVILFYFRISLQTGYDSEGNAGTVGVWEVQDDLFGDYNYTHATDGGSVTERYVLDGYGGFSYYGTVTTDESGTESFSLTTPQTGTYEMNYSMLYDGYYYDDEEGSGYDYNATQYNALTLTFSDKSVKRMHIASIPDNALGTPQPGVMSVLEELAGGYTLVNPVPLAYDMNGRKQLNVQTLHIAGADNVVQLWGATGVALNENGVSLPLSHLIFTGTYAAEEEQNGYAVYTITITRSGYTGIYAVGSTLQFYINDAGAAVFLGEEQTFALAEGGSFELDGFGVAHYTDAEGTTSDATYHLSVIGGRYRTYFFQSGEIGATFFEFDGGVHELLQYYEEANYTHSNAWSKFNLRSVSYNMATLFLCADDTALVYVVNTAGYTSSDPYFVGTVREGDEGEYTFTKLDDGSTGLESYNAMTFKLAEDGTFTVRSQYYDFSLTNEDESKLLSDGYGKATYTTADGQTHSGTIELLFETSNGAIDPTTLKFSSAYNETFYVLTEEDGSEWGFILKRSQSTSTQASFSTFTAVSGAEKLFGLWWQNADGGIGSSTVMYYYNGIILYAWGYSASGMSDWTDTVTPISETEDPSDYTFQFKDRNGKQLDTVYKVSFREVTALDGETKWNVAFLYDAAKAIDMEVVNDDGEAIGRIYCDGYFETTYFDYAADEEFDANVDSKDESSLALRYRDEENNIYSLAFDLIEKDGKTVAWLRTAPAFTAWLETREQLRDLNVYLVADGHGGATLYTEDAAAERSLKGTLEAIDAENGDYRFTSGEISMEFHLIAGVNSAGQLIYYFYYVYEGQYVGLYYEDGTFETIWLDGYHSATYIDKYGVRHDGEYNVLGAERSILEFYSTATGYRYFVLTYAGDGITPNAVMRAVDGDYAVEDGVIYGYQGGAVPAALPQGVHAIAPGAFYQRAITSIDLTGITEIGEYAFYGCESLTTVTNSGDVGSIGRYAFYDCVGLKAINLTGVETIEEYGFGYATALAEINLESIVRMGDYAFYYARALERIDLGSRFAHFGVQAFFNAATFSGHRINVYLHTTPETDYDELVGNGRKVFYQAEINLYVDSIEVVKAIYDSSMATQYRSEVYYEQYWELVRVAGTGPEQGFYVLADFTDYSKNAAYILQLDGFLTDGTVGTYPPMAYEVKEDGSIDLVHFTEQAGTDGHHFTVMNATFNERGSLLLGGHTWERIAPDRPIGYTAEDGTEVQVFGTGTVNNTYGSLSLTDLKLKIVYPDGLVLEDGTAKKTEPGKTQGYLQFEKANAYTIQVALKSDFSCELLSQNFYYFNAQTKGNSFQLLTTNGETKINTYSSGVEWRENGAYYTVSGVSQPAKRLDEQFDQTTLVDSFTLIEGAASTDTAKYGVEITFDHVTLTYSVKFTPTMGNVCYTLTPEDGTLIGDDRYDELEIYLSIDYRFDRGEIIGFYANNSYPRARLKGQEAYISFNKKGAYRNEDGTFTFYLGDEKTEHLLYGVYRVEYSVTDEAPAVLKATLIETSVASTPHTLDDGKEEQVVFTVDQEGNPTNVVGIRRGPAATASSWSAIGNVIKTADDTFDVVMYFNNVWTLVTVTYKAGDYELVDKGTTYTAGSAIKTAEGDMEVSFLLDEEGNAVGLNTFKYGSNNGGGSGTLSIVNPKTMTNIMALPGEKNQLKLILVMSNKALFFQITYTPSAGTFTYKQFRPNKMLETEDHLYRVAFTTDREGNVLGISAFQYRADLTKTYTHAYGADLLDAAKVEGAENTWTLTVSGVTYTIKYADGAVTVTTT